jgi:hypothetical protein
MLPLLTGPFADAGVVNPIARKVPARMKLRICMLESPFSPDI